MNQDNSEETDTPTSDSNALTNNILLAYQLTQIILLIIIFVLCLIGDTKLILMHFNDKRGHICDDGAILNHHL